MEEPDNALKEEKENHADSNYSGDGYEMRDLNEMKKEREDKMEKIKFDYFTSPIFESDSILDHFDYLVTKYVKHHAELEINISRILRHVMTGMPTSGADANCLLQRANDVRKELWLLLKHSFSRFKSNDEHRKLVRYMEMM